MGYIRAGVGRLRKLLSGQHSGHDPETAPAPGRENHPLIPQASASFDFTLPLHPSRVALVNQKVTANGIAITLREVKVSHVETRIDLVSTELSSAVLHENPPSNGPTYFPLTVGHLDLSYESDILN